MGLLHSLHSVTESANSVSLTLRPKGLVKIQINKKKKINKNIQSTGFTVDKQTALIYDGYVEPS